MSTGEAAEDRAAKIRKTHELLALTIPEPDRRQYYIRSAVDNYRRRASHLEGMKEVTSGTEPADFSDLGDSEAIKTLLAKDIPDTCGEELRDLVLQAARDFRRGKKPARNADRSRKEEEIISKLANYTYALQQLLETPVPGSSEALRDLVLATAANIRGGAQLIRREDDVGVKPEYVETAIKDFANELLERLEDPKRDDPVETVALIEYRLRYVGPFYDAQDRCDSEAICTYFLMQAGLRLPEYPNLSVPEYPEGIKGELDKASKLLPQIRSDTNRKPNAADMKKNFDELSKRYEVLKGEWAFQNWVDKFRLQFSPLEKHTPEVREPWPPKDRWKIRPSTELAHQSTLYHQDNVTRTYKEIDRIIAATGKWPTDAVVFWPRRMALHEIIAAAVTSIQMEHPTVFLQETIVGTGSLLEGVLQDRAFRSLERQFMHDRNAIKSFVEHVMDDPFHLENRNVEVRAVLKEARDKIEARISAKEYDPRMVESREVLRNVVIDELLRRRYQPQVRDLADKAIHDYLVMFPAQALPPKPKQGRIAWVTTGGPAAGKSSLDILIHHEYEQLCGNPLHLCQLNPDYYRTLVLPVVTEDDRAHHGSRTHLEVGHIRGLAMDRLEKMIVKEGLAPDVWISSMAPDLDRMSVAAQGGAKVNLYMVSCAPEVAVDRAYSRAESATNPDDKDRYVPTQDLLRGHKSASVKLVDALQARRQDVRLFDSNEKENKQDTTPTLIATMDSHNREMRVFDPKAFRAFVKKASINIGADSPNNVYEKGADDLLATHICAYLGKEVGKDAGNEVSINFRYHPDNAPNAQFARIEKAMNEKIEEEKEDTDKKRTMQAALQMMKVAEPETYMWAGHKRAVIRDFAAFVKAFGRPLAKAMLIELGLKKDWLLSVRDYNGKQLLLVDKNTLLFHTPSALEPTKESPKPIEADRDYGPESMKDQELRGVIVDAVATLSEELRPKKPKCRGANLIGSTGKDPPVAAGEYEKTTSREA